MNLATPLLVLAALAPSASAQQAAPAPQRFVALGDYGTTDPSAFEVAALVRRLDPTFIVTLGDNNYPDGEASTIDENIGQHYHQFIAPYLGTYGEGAVTNRFFPSLGNHDWDTTDAEPYLDYFTLPGNERYYDVRRGPLHMFVLDSDSEEPDGVRANSVQAAWLRDALARSSAAFKFVVMHHAPYNSSDNHGPQGDLQWPFKAWGASLVLSGHDHLYERISVGGLTYITNGLGGTNDIYDFAAPAGGSELRFSAKNGALVVDADQQFARFRFLTTLDTVQDEFVLPRGGVDPGTVELIPVDGLWSYLDTGEDPGASWARPNFDDSAWAIGPAELGYGESDTVTVVGYGGDPQHRYITTWFRHEFSLANPEAFETLQLRMLADDGAVAYLNGREIARVRMPAGTITPTTRASSASGNEEHTFYPFAAGAGELVSLQPRQLATGRNVLAVEVHQASETSNDLSFAADLVALRRGKTLLARGSSWRFLDTGAAPGPGWQAPAFDDSGWSAGRAQLGFGEGDEVTHVAEGPTTFWFRTTFDVADTAAIRWLSCRFLRDDGAIVYLNGAEALRLNLPVKGVTPGTFASFNVGQDDENQFSGTSLDLRLLRNGTNTIAVELHQASALSDDLSFDLELVAF